MRAICFKTIVFVFCFIGLSMNAKSQTEKINVDVKKETVANALKVVQKQTSKDILFNNEEVNKCQRITVKLVNESLERSIKVILESTHLDYKIVNNSVLITPKEVSTSTQEMKPNKELLQTVRGRVIDKDSRSPIPGANIILEGSNPIIGASSGADGRFKLEKIPLGRRTFRITSVGYEDYIASEVLIGSSKEVILNVEITEALYKLNAVEISSGSNEAKNQMAIVSAKSFSVEETQRYAASVSDPARMALVFAGVTTGDDSSNEIIIRGNSPNWMLWRLEGIEIPSPNHFAEEGFTSGAVSILSSNMVGVSDFYTGAFSAEYGNALSGVFDISLRAGNNEKREYSIQAGVLGVEVSAEGPFSKKHNASYLINYRYSTFSLLNAAGIKIAGAALPEYQDLSFKFKIPTQKFGDFSIWGIGGLSGAVEVYEPDTSLGEIFDYGSSDITKTGMYATGISHVIFPDKKSYIKTVIAATSSFSSNDVMDMDSLGVFKDSYQDDLQNKALRFNSFYNRKFSSKLTCRVGVSHSNTRYRFDSKTMDNSIWNVDLDQEGSTSMTEVYAQSKIKFNKKLTMTAGVHYARLALNKDQSIEPRLGLLYKLKNNQRLSFGYGIHSKPENLPVYFVNYTRNDGAVYQANRALDMTKSTHYIVAYEKGFSKMNVKLEAYYQHSNNLATPVNPTNKWATIMAFPDGTDTLDNIGKARSYGIELTIQRYFADDYYFLISSSLYQSEYMPASKEWLNTKFNSNYVSNFVGGKEFKWGDNKLIGLNAKIVWAGGKRMIPLDLEESIKQGSAVYEMDDMYSIKGKDYFRLDLGVKIHFFKEKTEHVISLDIQNATNRINEWAQIYDSQREKLVVYPMAGLIPILNYKVKF